MHRIGWHMKGDTHLNHLNYVSRWLVNWLENYSLPNFTMQNFNLQKTIKKVKYLTPAVAEHEKLQYHQLQLHAKFRMNRPYGFCLKGVLTPIVSHLLRRRDKKSPSSYSTREKLRMNIFLST